MMEAAIHKRATASGREFLRLFGRRHDGYDGAVQQEAFDFGLKLLQVLEAEEVASGEPAVDDTSLVKELFAVQKVTRVRSYTLWFLPTVNALSRSQ